MTKTYKAEQIFEDIPGDPDNVNMTIPPEVCEAAGIEPGDTVRIQVGDQGTLIIEKITSETKEKNE